MNTQSNGGQQEDLAEKIAGALVHAVIDDFMARKPSMTDCDIRNYWRLYNENVQHIVARRIMSILMGIPMEERGAFLGRIAFCRKSGDRYLFGYQGEDLFPGNKMPISEKARWHGMSRATLKITEGSNKEWDGPSKLLFEAMKAVMEELLPLTQKEITAQERRETSRA